MGYPATARDLHPASHNPIVPRSLTPFQWFAKKYGDPTPAQEAAWPLIARGANVLIASPTGTGKTFAAFLGVLEKLAALAQSGQLKSAIYCVYVSPLRALSYDLEKNLAEPLREIFGEKPPIRVELRTGDTTSGTAPAAIHQAAAYSAHHAGEPVRAAQPGEVAGPSRRACAG